jgi:hypothetical protein
VAQKDMRISAENDKNVSRSCKHPRLMHRLHGNELIILQPVSAIEPLQILRDSLRPHLKSNGAHRGITLNYFCRRINLSSLCD